MEKWETNDSLRIACPWGIRIYVHEARAGLGRQAWVQPRHKEPSLGRRATASAPRPAGHRGHVAVAGPATQPQPAFSAPGGVAEGTGGPVSCHGPADGAPGCATPPQTLGYKTWAPRGQGYGRGVITLEPAISYMTPPSPLTHSLPLSLPHFHTKSLQLLALLWCERECKVGEWRRQASTPLTPPSYPRIAPSWYYAKNAGPNREE